MIGFTNAYCSDGSVILLCLDGWYFTNALPLEGY